MIDMEQESTLVESLKFEEPASEGADQIGLARVYPFGRSNVKEKKYHDVVTPHAALSLAVQSLPTDAMTSLKDSEEVSSFLMECMMTSPSRFPVVLVVDYNDPFPPAFISLSIRLKRYFSFGRLDYSATTLLEELDLVKLQLQPPTLVVMASYVSEGKLVQQAIPYKTEQTGSCYKDEEDDDKCMLSYPKLLQFLYNVNRQYRQDLPGNNLADDEEAMMMEDVIDNEKRRFKVNRGSNARSPTLPKVGRRKGITIDMQHGGTIEL